MDPIEQYHSKPDEDMKNEDAVEEEDEEEFHDLAQPQDGLSDQRAYCNKTINTSNAILRLLTDRTIPSSRSSEITIPTWLRRPRQRSSR